MSYSESNLDRTLKSWFKTDPSCASLHKIILSGKIRSLNDIVIDLDYPISAFAGKNGCGKTTVLALAACAYHNFEKGFKVKPNKKTYYTFSDFFIQTQEEVKPEGIQIIYHFFYNNWKNAAAGIGRQRMTKRKGGKWTNYEKRVRKNVVYLGIDRIVPQTEKQVYKSYVKHFIDEAENDWHSELCMYVGRILGKSYSQFKIKKAGSYNLQLVKDANHIYSGFNMGAGEKALFELFSIIYQCANSGKAALIIIDEIELGLHETAQRKLIAVLKEICKKKKLQIICTTHSPAILDSLPPDARFYIEKVGHDTFINKGISGDFAAGRLSDSHSNELDIYIEDDIAEVILMSSLNLEKRQRVGLVPVGSHAAVIRQLAAAYRHPRLKNKSIAILDGDQRSEQQNMINNMERDLELSTPTEKTKFKEWVKDKIYFLPGTVAPEKWLLKKAVDNLNKELADRFGIRKAQLEQELHAALIQPAHDEFYYLSQQLSLDTDVIINEVCRFVSVFEKPALNTLSQKIDLFLD